MRKWIARLWGIFSVFSALVGIGGWPDDTANLLGWFGFMSPQWSGFLVALGLAGLLFSALLLWGDRLDAWWKQFRGSATPQDSSTADYMTATAIIDGYLQHATVDMRPGVNITIRTDILKRFEESPGAMLGEGIYSREHLHLWMQTNMGRLLIRYRGDL